MNSNVPDSKKVQEDLEAFLAKYAKPPSGPAKKLMGLVAFEIAHENKPGLASISLGQSHIANVIQSTAHCVVLALELGKTVCKTDQEMSDFMTSFDQAVQKVIEDYDARPKETKDKGFINLYNPKFKSTMRLLNKELPENN